MIDFVYGKRIGGSRMERVEAMEALGVEIHMQKRDGHGMMHDVHRVLAPSGTNRPGINPIGHRAAVFSGPPTLSLASLYPPS
jgi:hypothetical protein